MFALYNLIDTVLSLYVYALFFRIIADWLIVFGILNSYNQFVLMVLYFLKQITEPALQFIRKITSNFFSPYIGGVDISPMILILLIWFIKDLMLQYLVRL